jgi:hypothetical protein
MSGLPRMGGESLVRDHTICSAVLGSRAYGAWPRMPPTPTYAGSIALREAFLSQLVHQTFAGYAHSQHKKLESDIRLRGAPR